MKNLAYSSAVILLSCWIGIASAAPITDEEGRLMGATGIEVEEQLYDVLFLDGTAEALFSTAGVYKFVFDNVFSAEKASQALLDQVFIHGQWEGYDMTVFDERPSLTNGVTQSNYAEIWTPYEQFDQGSSIRMVAAINRNYGKIDYISPSDIILPAGYDMTQNQAAVYGVWTPVPLPSTMTLLGLGIACLAGVRKKRKRKALTL